MVFVGELERDAINRPTDSWYSLLVDTKQRGLGGTCDPITPTLLLLTATMIRWMRVNNHMVDISVVPKNNATSTYCKAKKGLS